jgi:uncharacterized protein YrrD
MAQVENLAAWRGKDLIDQDGNKLGKLEDVYVDTQTDEAIFGSLKEGLLSKHLTFVPLRAASVSPDGLTVGVSKAQVKDAPNIDQDGELDGEAESELYRHYGLAYAPASTPSGRRLARR